MKKTILSVVAASLLICSFSNCQDPQKKVENAEENLAEAKADLTEAQVKARDENFKEWQKFRNDAEDRIRDNEKKIDMVRARTQDPDKKNLTAEEEARLKELEEKNQSMRRKIYDYADADSENWKNFKNDFDREMDDIEEAIRNVKSDAKK